MGRNFVFPVPVQTGESHSLRTEGRETVWAFEGPLLHVYSTLVVRLDRSLFRSRIRSRSARTASFTRRSSGGKCGVALREVEQGQGELILFFDERSRNPRLLRGVRRATPATLGQPRISPKTRAMVCDSCGARLSTRWSACRSRWERNPFIAHCIREMSFSSPVGSTRPPGRAQIDIDSSDSTSRGRLMLMILMSLSATTTKTRSPRERSWKTSKNTGVFFPGWMNRACGRA